MLTLHENDGPVNIEELLSKARDQVHVVLMDDLRCLNKTEQRLRQNGRITLVASPSNNGILIGVTIVGNRITAWTIVGMEGILNAIIVIDLDIK